MNENLVCVVIASLAVILTAFGLDDGSIIKTVISAYLGYIVGKRIKK